MEAFPDLASLPDAALKALTEEKMAEELDVSRRRRELHQRIDVLRAEHTRRLKERHATLEVDAAALSDELLAQTPDELSIEADDALLPTGDESDDAAQLSDDELRRCIQDRTRSEREVSFKRRMIHGHIDLLRAEIVARLRDRDGQTSDHLAASDVDRLSEILAHTGPPLELPAELERLD